MEFSRPKYWSGLPLLSPPALYSSEIVEMEKMLESPLDCKEIQLVHPKGNQS